MNFNIVKLILEYYEEFGIDIKKHEETALDHLKQGFKSIHSLMDLSPNLNFCDPEEYQKLIRQLEEEYAKIDASKPTD